MDIDRPYIIFLPVKMRELARLLNTLKFEESSKEGFLLDRTSDSHIEARFVQKFQRNQTLLGPLGNEFTSQLLEYRQTRLFFSDGPIGLQVINPAVGWKQLFSALERLVGSSFEFRPCEVDLLRWHAGLTSSTALAIEPVRVETTPIEMDHGARGVLSVSGPRNILQSTESFLTEFTYTLTSVLYRARSEKIIQIAIYRDGSYKISGSASEVVRRFIESVRVEALAKKPKA